MQSINYCEKKQNCNTKLIDASKAKLPKINIHAGNFEQHLDFNVENIFQELALRCMLFTDDTILFVESEEDFYERLETRR